MDTNIKGKGRKQRHPKGREGRQHRPRGQSNATHEKSENSIANQKNEVGKQHHPKGTRRWDAAHSKEEGKSKESNTTHRKLR